jgi:hypothetical protein
MSAPMKGAVLVALLLARASATFAQADPCDPAIKGKEDRSNPSGYHLRSDRCEGIFLQDVSATGSLLVASLTATMQGFKPEGGKPLEVEWRAPGAGRVNLRAYSLRPKLYYRMDTVQEATSPSYAWPPAILATYAVQATDVGLVGWTSITLGDQHLEPVYIPVGIRASKETAWPASIRLVLVSPADLKEIYVTVSPLDATGVSGKPLRDGPLGYGYYPAGGAVRIDLAPWPKSGIYLVQLAAARKDGANVVNRFWMYQP